MKILSVDLLDIDPVHPEIPVSLEKNTKRDVLGRFDLQCHSYALISRVGEVFGINILVGEGLFSFFRDGVDPGHSLIGFPKISMLFHPERDAVCSFH